MDDKTELWKPLYDSPIHLISNNKRIQVKARRVYINYGADKSKNFRDYPEKILVASRVSNKYPTEYVAVKYISPLGKLKNYRINVEEAYKYHFPEEPKSE